MATEPDQRLAGISNANWKEMGSLSAKLSNRLRSLKGCFFPGRISGIKISAASLLGSGVEEIPLKNN